MQPLAINRGPDTAENNYTLSYHYQNDLRAYTDDTSCPKNRPFYKRMYLYNCWQLTYEQ